MCCCFLLVALALPYFCLPLLLCLQFSHSVVPNSLQPHGLQHVRLPVHHQLPELAQTHVHQVGDAIQLFHPLLSRSSAFNQLSLSNNLGLVPGISKDTKTWKCSILLYKVAYYLHITYACLPV